MADALWFLFNLTKKIGAVVGYAALVTICLGGWSFLAQVKLREIFPKAEPASVKNAISAKKGEDFYEICN
jgi:tetrahydromethanopterin S-methyltransferase subunit E